MGMLTNITRSGLAARDRVIESQLLGRPSLPRPVERAVLHQVAIQYGRGIVAGAQVEAIRSSAWHAQRALEDLESPVNSPLQNLIVEAATVGFIGVVRSVGRA
jgi:hypothetical protein